VQLVHQRFGPPLTESPLGELVLLCRVGTVEEYTEQFLALACRDADLSDHQLVQIYTAGLSNPLKTDVALRRPATLDDAIMLARAYEQRMQLHPTDQAPSRGDRAHAQSSPAPIAARATQAASSAASAPSGSGKAVAVTSSLPRRRLSQAEMTQRRAEGLCFNCDEKYVQGHRCKKLFVLEVDDTDDDEEVDEEIECSALTLGEELPGISLHAITGVRAKGFQTMKVFVSVGDAVAVALLDTGSSHNFIDIGMARRAGLRLRERRNFSVAVANGDRVTSKGKALAQTVHIGGEAFVLDLYALPLGDYDIVLGVQWLGTLEPVLWDFARHTVAFQRGDRHILCRGVDPMPGPSGAVDGRGRPP
jgi:predicted aspartyl protease